MCANMSAFKTYKLTLTYLIYCFQFDVNKFALFRIRALALTAVFVKMFLLYAM